MYYLVICCSLNQRSYRRFLPWSSWLQQCQELKKNNLTLSISLLSNFIWYVSLDQITWKVYLVLPIIRNSLFKFKEGRHCCSVGELKITFASTCKESVFNVLFNVLFLVLDFPLGAPNTLLKRVIERSIWRIVVGEGSWWGWGFSQDWWLGFWSCWNLSLTAVFWIDFSVACFKRV